MPVSPNTLTAATLYRQSADTADQVENSNAILVKMRERGNIDKIGGGLTLEEVVDYAGPTAQWFSDYEQLNHQPFESTTRFSYDWKQCAVPIIASGMEVRKNKGSDVQLFDFLSRKIDVAKRSLKNAIANSMRGDGTGFNGTSLTGLQALIPDTAASGSLGGQSRTTYSWARAISYGFTTNLGKTMGAATIEEGLLNAWMQVVRGTTRPDLILMTQSFYSAYHGALSGIRRMTDENSSLAKAGFRALEYQGAPVILDDGFGEGSLINTERCYMLNTEFLRFKVHKDLYFAPLGGEREPIDADAVLQYLGLMGNLTLSAPAFQAVILTT